MPADNVRYIPVSTLPELIVPGTPGNDVLEGTKDAETFIALAGSDIETGDGGNDVFIMGPGRDFIGGGGVNDTAIFEGLIDEHDIAPILDSDQPDAIVTDTNPSDGDSGMDRLSGIETYEFKDALVDAATGDITPKTDGTFSFVPVTAIPAREGFGTADGNRLIGGKAAEFFDAGDGNDTSTGDGGDDVFLMGPGDDFIGGGGGDNDTAIFDGSIFDYFGLPLGDGQFGIIDLEPSDGDSGIDILGGVEIFEFKDALFNPANFDVALKADGFVSYVPVTEIPERTAFGIGEDDRLIGSNVAELFDGGRGSDDEIGNGGDDVFIMGEGRDFIGGGGGNDTAIFDGLFEDYDIQEIAGLAYFVTDLNPNDGDSGKDRLGGVETFEFMDALFDATTGDVTFKPVTSVLLPAQAPDLSREIALLAGE